MRNVTSCGILLFRREPELSFLLMKAENRFDLPKGHLEPGETHLECAKRELWEETGLNLDLVIWEESFQFTTQYPVNCWHHGPALKNLIVFLGWLTDPQAKIQPTEHVGHEWVRWAPPHQIQRQTIDDLLKAASDWFDQSG